MEIKSVLIENYKGISESLSIPLSKKIIPLVGVNESGKTTVLEAVFAFDVNNDVLNQKKHVTGLNNLYKMKQEIPKVTLELDLSFEQLLITLIEDILTEQYKKLRTEITSINEYIDMNAGLDDEGVLTSQFITLESLIEKSESQSKGKLYVQSFSTFYNHLSKICSGEEYNQLLKKSVENEEFRPSLSEIFSKIDELKAIREFVQKGHSDVYTVISRSFPLNGDPFYSLEIEDDILKLIEPFSNKLVTMILERLPQFVYLDEFSNLPTERINLDDVDNSWYTIYDRVFRSITLEHDKMEVGLADIDRLDETLRDTLLSRVQQKLSQRFRNAWKDLIENEEKIDLTLKLDKKIVPKTDEEGNKINIVENYLNIGVVEISKEGTPSNFKLSSRSKGFIWYYNFIMNTYFIHNRKGNGNRTLFLLDEPGSYLHETAQKELLRNLVTQSESDIVVYSTHLPALLDPDMIPANNIQIVQKKGGNITSTNVTNYTTRKEKSHALEAVYEALKRPLYSSQMNKFNIVCVEGIYDMYFLDVFCDLNSKIKVFPSVSATTIHTNISYFITYGIDYLSIWDNDYAGNTELNKAANYFGPLESKKFTTLTIAGDGVTEMETVLHADDYIYILEVLDLTDSKDTKQNYQNILLKMKFDTSKNELEDILKNLHSTTVNKISKITSFINRNF